MKALRLNRSRSISGMGADSARLLRIGARTGLIGALRPLRATRLLPHLLHHPMGAGLIHALWAAMDPNRPALQTPERTLRYAEVDQRLNQLIHALKAQGFARGHRLALMAPNGQAYLLGLFAALRAGWGAVHVSYRLTRDELVYQLEHSRPRALIFAPEAWPVVSASMETIRARSILLLPTQALAEAPHLRPLHDWLRGQPTRFPASRGRLRAMPNLVYTSGTTGRPKGAVRDFAQLGLREMSRILERLPYRTGERHLVVAPLYHAAAQAFCILHAAAGSTLIPMAHFDAEAVLRALHTRAIDSVFLVPTMIRRLLDLPDETWRRYPPRLRSLVSGAAPFPHAMRLPAIARFGPVVHDFYGSTEAGWVTLVGSQEMLERPSTLGRAIPGTRIYILDPEGHPLPPGERGRIAVRSGQRMEGYLRNRTATQNSLEGDLLVTGDLGTLDDQGYLYLSGRSSDLIISGGVNVYPAEVEQVLLAHPSVREAAVVGLPDDDWGERVCAFVVGPRPDDQASLLAHCRAHLAGFKVPRRWFFPDHLPRNATGKVLRRALRDQHGEGSGDARSPAPRAPTEH